MRRRWIVVPAIAGLLAVAAIGTALAQSDEGGATTPAKNFVARVAEILGIEEARVQEAFNQASREMHDEALQRHLAHKVEAGLLTQEEADEILEWYRQRPEALAGRFMFPGPRHHLGVVPPKHRHFHQGMRPWLKERPMPAPVEPEGTSF